MSRVPPPRGAGRGGRALPHVEPGSLAAWRVWLEGHHASSPGVWLVFRKTRAQGKTIAYEDAVREALCFGWIDSLVRRLDDDRYARKFTPRKPTSKWSDLNRKRWKELATAGLLRPAGKVAAPTEHRYARRPATRGLPAYVERALKAHPKAWSFFRRLAPTYRGHFVLWIDSAKRADTRERRIRESLRYLESGRKLPLK